MKENIFKTMRVNAGLSQCDVAKRMGYTSSQFCSNWERNLSVPPPNSVKKLAKIFGVDAGDFADSYIEFVLNNLRKDLEKKIARA